MTITDGQLVALIGSNGAGKTTLLNAISGLVPADDGDITWNNIPLLGSGPDEICRYGIIQVPEGRKLFSQMTVEENLEIGAYLRDARVNLKDNKERVFKMFPHLKERRRQRAESLSGGEQQMVAVARAIMADPKVLMFDEPSLGLSPIAAADIFDVIKDLNKQGLTVLVVSQEVMETLTLADYAYVIENGIVVLNGPAKQLMDDPRIKESYLGF